MLPILLLLPFWQQQSAFFSSPHLQSTAMTIFDFSTLKRRFEDEVIAVTFTLLRNNFRTRKAEAVWDHKARRFPQLRVLKLRKLFATFLWIVTGGGLNIKQKWTQCRWWKNIITLFFTLKNHTMVLSSIIGDADEFFSTSWDSKVISWDLDRLA